MIRRLVLPLCALALVSVAGVVYIGNADLGRFKDQLTPLVSESLGRELHIDGDLSLYLGRTVKLRAEDVSLANPAWAAGPHFLQVADVEAEVDLWSLIRGPVRVESLVLHGANIHLQAADDGRRNWLPPNADTAEEGKDTDGRMALPRIGALKASDVRIALAARQLTGASEIILDAADYAVGDDQVIASTSGEINGYPLALAIRMVPTQHPPPADGLRIAADVRMGHVSLDADILIENTNTLAVSAADLELAGADVDHLLRVLKLPKVTSGPLAIKASLRPDPQRSAFDAAGRIGEYDFAAHGWLEDLRGTGGFDVSMRLAGPSLAALGRPFDVPILPDLPFDVETELRSRAAGIEFEDTRVIIGQEQGHGTGTIVWLPDDGHELHVRAEYRDMSSKLLVTFPASWPASQLGFDLGVESENAIDPARYLGLDHLDGQPFVLSAKGAYGGRTVLLREASVNVGEQELALTGSADDIDGAPDIDLRFDAANIDLSPWLASDVLGLRTVAATGRLKVSQGILAADELEIESGDVLIEGGVSLPLADRGRKGRLALHLKAPAVDRLIPDLAGTLVQGQSVDLRADGHWSPGEWRLDEILWRIPERGDLQGSISFAESETRSVQVRLSAASLDLRPAKDAARAPPSAAVDDRVIPARKIPIPRSDDLRVDLEVDIASLHSPMTAGASLLLEARLADDQLIVDRLETNGKRGQMRASLTVAADPTASLEAQLQLTGRRLYIAAPDEPATTLTARPRFDFEATLQAEGTDLRELAQTLNGHLLIQAEKGTITRRGGVLVTLVMDDFLSRTLETINPLIKDRDEVQLNCFVVLADIQNGKVQGAPLVALQTTEVNLVTRGEIDLSSESLTLDIVTSPRRGFGISLGDIINPFTRIGGTLASPRLVADPQSAVLETGAGILSGGAWIVARKLRDRFFAGNPCAKALKGRNETNRQP